MITQRRGLFTRWRRLVPADAFYEWQKIDAKTKQPFAIGMKDGSPYAFAGLWERRKDAATKDHVGETEAVEKRLREDRESHTLHYTSAKTFPDLT
jgi:putative SOS response-associated peptidase YedK